MERLRQLIHEIHRRSLWQVLGISLASMRRLVSALACVLLGNQAALAQASVGPTETADPTVVAFVNVAVVSMQEEALLPEQTVVIEGERILSIGPAGALSVPPGATVIDGSGRFLMPGLADMHVHVRVPFDDGPLYLAAGITTALSLGTGARASTVALAWQKVLQERERTRTTGFMGPTLYVAGPQIQGNASDTPDADERIVRDNAESGFDVVKVHGDVSPESFDRLHDTARRLGIRVTGHGQRHRGMQPIYAHRQDLAHVEEYLYAAFNPRTPAMWTAVAGLSIALILFSLANVSWWMGAMWRRLRKQRITDLSSGSRRARRLLGVFAGTAWLLFVGLFLSVTDPLAGVFAGETVAISLVLVLMLLVLSVAIVLTMHVRSVWREGVGTSRSRAAFLSLVGLAWTFVACAGFLTPRSWRATEAAMERIAQETLAAGIWVTPNLVSLDYVKRHNTDEFYELIRRPEMRYVRPATRDLWINNNEFRQLPEAMRPVQFAIWQRWMHLMSELTGKLHAAGVPLLAGSDAPAPDGVMPGVSLHEELNLLVEAGLSPYEALQTATVNPAIYMEAEQEFGRVAVGLRADLVLLNGNPLEDIGHARSPVGVMKRGRWFSASELDAALEQLAQERM